MGEFPWLGGITAKVIIYRQQSDLDTNLICPINLQIPLLIIIISYI